MIASNCCASQQAGDARGAAREERSTRGNSSRTEHKLRTVKPRCILLVPLDRPTEQPPEQLRLQPRDDGIRAQNIKKRAVVLDDPHTAIAPLLHRSHVTGGIARRTRFLDALEKRGVLMIAYTHGQVRAVTHYGIGDEEITKTIAATAAALTETA